MTCWIIYAKESIRDGKDNAFDWMVEVAEEYDIKAHVLFSEDFDVNEQLFYKDELLLELPDCILMRTYDFSLGNYFEDQGVRVYNKMEALEACQDKWKTYELLKKCNLPTIETLIGEYTFSALKETIGLPFVMKDRFGSKGEGVYLVNNEEEFSVALESLSDVIYQPFIPCGNSDVRVHVIDGEPVAWVKRYNPNDFRSNFSQGGSAVAFDPDEALLKLARQGVHALGLEIGGIDILITDSGYTICEVNGISGFRTIYKIGGPSIPEFIFKMIGGK